ncbi:MAG: alpha/beta hydrolase [Pararhodobacter sp.]|nr:alpha/beta hydrolase [Pararhodobacter sp.]
MTEIASRYVMVDGVRTHYLEAGSGPPLVLLHSGEFGASAELTWEFNLIALAKHFRVIAPDWLGYGKTDKIFDFCNMWNARINHITRFLQVLCIGQARFMGNSMGATLLLGHAAETSPDWDIERMIIVSGGGLVPENEARQLLNSYDGSREHMERIVRGIYMRAELHDDQEFIERRYQSSLEPGAWECTAAARFRAPFTAPRGYGRSSGYEQVKAPCMIIAGEKDNLRMPGYANELQAQVPGSRLTIMPDAGHCPQIDCPETFNDIAISYLTDALTISSGSRTSD